MTTLRDELLEHGLLVATGVDGLYARSGRLEDVIEGLQRFVERLAEDERPERLRFPPLMPRVAFEQTDYLRSFPNLTGSIHTFTGNDRDHAALLATLEDGGDWSTALTPTPTVLCSAACHPVYPLLTGTLPEDGRRFDVIGWCFRHEPSHDPARMQSFRQHEKVYVGDSDGALAHSDTWLERGLEALTGLGLDVRSEVANDPFFGRLGRMLAANQREEAAKFEIVATVANADAPTAISSANYHGDHFGHAFDITTSDGNVAHTACIGFGLERIALALVVRHGFDIDQWPHAVREQLR